MTARNAALTPARRVGYRLLGQAFDYVLHLRPAEWPILAAHTALGYGLAVGLTGVLAGQALDRALAALGIWVLLLNGGTLALNSAFDRDEGDIGYLRQPPPPPRYLATVALLLMVAGQGLSAFLPPGFGAIYAICFTLSLAYSVPPLRLKAVAGADWLINMWGFGTLTPLAGYAAAGLPLDGTRALVMLAFCPLFAGLYPLTQLYQLDEDRRRGDRTLALKLGARRSLLAAIAATGVAFATFGWAAVRAGWSLASEAGVLRWSGLGVALAGWLRVLVPWLAQHATMTPTQHQRGMYAALGAWAVTDLVVFLGWGL